MLRSAYYAIFSGLTRLAGFRGSEVMAAMMARVRYTVNGKRNGPYLGHLARIFPDRSDRERMRMLMGFWRVHQRAFLGLFNTARLNTSSLTERVEWSGKEALDEAIAEGRGVVMAAPHFGDERTLHILLAIAGYPMHVISSRYSELSERVRKARLGVSMRWHHVGFPDENPAWIYRALKAGEVVQISPTAWGGPKGHWVINFGVPFLASSTPLRLAASTGCAIVLGCNHALYGSRYRLEFLRFRPEESGPAGTAEMFTRFEDLGRTWPDQYNWMNLVIRHRETNTLARLGRIPRGEREVEEAAIPEDWNPNLIRNLEEVSGLCAFQE
ncbi:MAG: hypothetical protein AVO35_05680 [Candidatus Aegiribacteria sp. MLS_C]|nr:MAG: hypothetical protein AVO35_05680 [Candidatus Aegiribacteria sp. MLS_C]